MLDKSKLVTWLESVKKMAKKDQSLLYATYTETSDAPYSIVAGWEPGYDSLNDLLCCSKSNPNYAMCVKIAINNKIPTAYSDFEFLDMPYDKETNEVDDTSMALEWDDNLEDLADWLISEWERIMEEYKDVDWYSTCKR